MNPNWDHLRSAIAVVNVHKSTTSPHGADIIDVEYDALSYVWGGEDPLTEAGRAVQYLYVRNGPEERSKRGLYSWLTITPNLATALRSFRQNPDIACEVYLWVDAICINQDSSVEKGAQIQRMAKTYSEASTVRVWLGEECEDSMVAFKFIEQILSLEDFDSLISESHSCEQWDAFRNLMHRSWFKRRWIVQEIAFAKKALVYCGDKSLPWPKLEGAISLFADASSELRQLFQGSSRHAHNPDYLGEVAAYSAKALVDHIGLMFRKSADDDVMERLFTLESLLSNLTPFESKDPRDCVYAIIHLSNDALPVSKRTMDRIAQSLNAAQLTEAPQSSGASFENLICNGQRTQSPDSLKQGTDLLPNPTSPQEAIAGSEQQRGRPTTRKHLSPEEEHTRPKSRARTPSPAAARRRAEKRAEQDAQHKTLPKHHFVVDYDQSLYNLCVEVINFIVQRAQSLDIICKPWVPEIKVRSRGGTYKIHPEDRVTMPSWIQSLRKRRYGLASDPHSKGKRYIRLAADSLVGTDIFGRKAYSASGPWRIPADFQPFRSLITDRTLNARGFVLDRVGDMASTVLSDVIPHDWLSFGGWHDPTEDPPEPFWRTLVANRESSNGPKQPPKHWPYACKWAFGRKAEGRHLKIDDLIFHVYGQPSTRVLPFLQRMRAVIWNRQLIRTSRLNTLGLAPADVKQGDLICILYGCSVPVLLRPRRKAGGKRAAFTNPHQNSRTNVRRGSSKLFPKPNGVYSAAQAIPPTLQFTGSEGEQVQPDMAEESSQPDHMVNGHTAEESESQYYTLVGECYIHGMMDGEAFLQQEELGISESDFQIGCAQGCNCGNC
jgi:Heterokaryon incompatibility protein (HET)